MFIKWNLIILVKRKNTHVATDFTLKFEICFKPDVILFLPNIPTVYLKDFVAGRCSSRNCGQKQCALGRILTPQSLF